MNTAMPQEKLEQMLDLAVREVTEQVAGVRLHPGADPPEGDLCTVHIRFKKGFHTDLSLCADTSMLTQMARNAICIEHVTPQDLEDFSKEYFNVLCGKIAAVLFHATKVSSRFSVPSFYAGRYEPEDREKQFMLNYSTDRQEGAQLIHLIPRTCREGDAQTSN